MLSSSWLKLFHGWIGSFDLLLLFCFLFLFQFLCRLIFDLAKCFFFWLSMVLLLVLCCCRCRCCWLNLNIFAVFLLLLFSLPRSVTFWFQYILLSRSKSIMMNCWHFELALYYRLSTWYVRVNADFWSSSGILRHHQVPNSCIRRNQRYAPQYVAKRFRTATLEHAIDFANIGKSSWWAVPSLFVLLYYFWTTFLQEICNCFVSPKK